MRFYTFNYTYIRKNAYKIDKSKVVYLHGEVNEDCENKILVKFWFWMTIQRI
jgi:hypothetical protein